MFKWLKQHGEVQKLVNEATHASMIGFHEGDNRAIVRFTKVTKCVHCHRDVLGPSVLQSVIAFPGDVKTLNPRAKIVDNLGNLPESFRSNKTAVNHEDYCLFCLKSGHAKF